MGKPTRGRCVAAAARYAAVLLSVFSFEVAMAQSAVSDCNAVIDAANATIAAKTDELNRQEQLTNQAVANAKGCIDRMLQMIRSMSPSIPSIQSGSISAIVDYLSNRACAVATSAVSNTLQPISNATTGAVNGAVGAANGAITPITGTSPVTTRQTTLPDMPVSAQPQTGTGTSTGSIFTRVGCMFSGNC